MIILTALIFSASLFSRSQLSYAIGVAKPLSIFIDSYGTVAAGKTDADLLRLVETVRHMFHHHIFFDDHDFFSLIKIFFSRFFRNMMRIYIRAGCCVAPDRPRTVAENNSF